jgi:hypothetical protein
MRAFIKTSTFTPHSVSASHLFPPWFSHWLLHPTYTYIPPLFAIPQYYDHQNKQQAPFGSAAMAYYGVQSSW